eukprot:scaffold1409_cov245-Pinguiococcus_pyrenoidosus.AAC.8
MLARELLDLPVHADRHPHHRALAKVGVARAEGDGAHLEDEELAAPRRRQRAVHLAEPRIQVFQVVHGPDSGVVSFLAPGVHVFPRHQHDRPRNLVEAALAPVVLDQLLPGLVGAVALLRPLKVRREGVGVRRLAVQSGDVLRHVETGSTGHPAVVGIRVQELHVVQLLHGHGVLGAEASDRGLGQVVDVAFQNQPPVGPFLGLQPVPGLREGLGHLHQVLGGLGEAGEAALQHRVLAAAGRHAVRLVGQEVLAVVASHEEQVGQALHFVLLVALDLVHGHLEVVERVDEASHDAAVRGERFCGGVENGGNGGGKAGRLGLVEK